MSYHGDTARRSGPAAGLGGLPVVSRPAVMRALHVVDVTAWYE